MAGSKRERAPGVWELRVYTGMVHGKRQQVSRTHRGDAKSAEVELARLVVAVADGTHAPPAPVDPDDPTVGEWMEAWYARESPDWSPTSAATARTVLDVHLLQDLGDMRLSELRLRDVEQWLRTLRARGLSPASQIRYFSVLRGALEQAERWELIARNPAAKAELPRVRYEETHIPTAAELVEALQVAPTIHHRTLIWLAAATGGRRGQLVALRWSDFDLDEGLVTFHRAAVKIDGGATVKEPKGGRPIRAALDDDTVEVVRTYRRHRQEQALGAGVGRLRPGSYVFARDVEGRECWYPDRASKMWHQVRSARAEGADGELGELLLPGLQGVRLHDLRHAHATLLIAAGVDRKTVAGRLGHAQVSTTDRYTHPVTAADRAAADIMGRLLAGGA
jgi:integrase